jgi:ABC-type antimicrobial peptide transport system permease subunit
MLTMVGVVIGVAAVTLIMALGQGIKEEVANEIDKFGGNIVIIRPGAPVTTGSSLSGLSLFNISASSSLTTTDVTAAQKTPGIASASPLMYVSGNVQHQNNTINNASIIATNNQLGNVLSENMSAGEFFDPNITSKNVAVIGQVAAQKLFGTTTQIGDTINIRGQSFIVIGILGDTALNNDFTGLLPDASDSIFIPLAAGQSFYQGSTQIQEIIARIGDPAHDQQVTKALNNNILAQHGYNQDFTIIQQQQALSITNTIIKVLTAFTAAIASISLVVGGVGVMNIMLVSVTERTKEIGIRKSIGATNGQILGQFLIEAMVISLGGGIIGVGLAYLGSELLSLKLNFSPVITPAILAVAFGVSSGIGIIFGIAPAFKAARKDPIEALRHE